MLVGDYILPTPEELKREAKKIMREKHVNYTKAQMIVLKSYLNKEKK